MEARRRAEIRPEIRQKFGRAQALDVSGRPGFKSGAQLGTWLGLVPKQHSSGGKSHLGTITKRGDAYLRTLLIQGAKSVVKTAHTRADPISKWVLALKERSGWQKAVLAMANKNAQTLWAVMTRGEAFDRHHLSKKPGAKVKPDAGAPAAPA